MTTEAVRTPMRYYTDSSHFTEMVGDWILRRMLSDDGSVPADFGVRLTESNVEVHLESVRRERTRFLQDHPDVVKHWQDDYRQTVGGAPLDQARLEGMF